LNFWKSKNMCHSNFWSVKNTA